MDNRQLNSDPMELESQKPRNKRRFDGKREKEKDRPSAMDRIRARRNSFGDDDGYLDDFEDEFFLDADLDIEDLEDLGDDGESVDDEDR